MEIKTNRYKERDKNNSSNKKRKKLLDLIATGYGLDGRGSIPVREKRFFSSP
jgi:hypothetical protein